MGDPKDAYKFYKSNMANLDKSIKKQEKEREEPTKEITVPVRIKSEHKDDWMKDLNISIKVNKISQTRQLIDIQVTDAQDPQVLYTVELGDQEFFTLKHEQSLRIEFQQFPQMFIEMLEYCNNNFEKFDKIDDNMSHRSTISTYGCLLHQTNISEGLLIIQESTQYRQLNHLILKLKAASDTTLKNHLSGIVKEFKLRNENFQEENNKLNSLLDKCSIDQKNLKDELMFINEKQ